MDSCNGRSDPRLQEYIKQAIDANRPLIHHLNPDSSWLLQLPLANIKSGVSEKAWYNILIDPWLSGSQSDIASWFSTQRHAVECAVSSIAAVESLLRDVEQLTRQYRASSNAEAAPQANAAIEPPPCTSLIDVIAISHEFTDHCHKDTLLQCDPATPILAPRKAAGIIRSWKHFQALKEMPAFPPSGSKDWRDVPACSLPPWLRIARLTSARDVQYFHSALAFVFDCAGAGACSEEAVSSQAAETVIYTPHGYLARDLRSFHNLYPPVWPLALLHGLHNVTMPAKVINYGAFNGLEAQRILRAKYWIGTHDEIKIPGGIIKYLLRRKAYGIRDVLEHERAKQASGAVAEDGEKVGVLDETSYVDIGNGQSFVLK